MVTYEKPRHVKRRFVQKGAPRAAIAEIVDGTFHIRQPAIWGNVTTACASDLAQLGGLRPELDDRVERSLWRPRRRDLPARGDPFHQHLLAAAPMFVLRGSRHDRSGESSS